MADKNYSYAKISPTAKVVSYFRKFSDIPFTNDVVELFSKEPAYQEIIDSLTIDDSFNPIAPMLELRYKSIQNFITKNNYSQVLELASGIAMRGLNMTKDPNMVYVETDLKSINEEKLAIIDKIKTKYNIKTLSNLFFHQANALSYFELEQTLKHFNNNKPLVIVNEGLLQYLDKNEKSLVAKNIHKLLSEFNGCWVTPDLSSVSQMHGMGDKDKYKKFIDIFAKATSRNFEQTAFLDDKDIDLFFDDLGFTVDKIPQLTADINLSTLPKEQSDLYQEANKLAHLWVLKTK